MKGYSPKNIDLNNSRIQTSTQKGIMLELGEFSHSSEGGEKEIGEKCKGSCTCKTKNCRTL